MVQEPKQNGARGADALSILLGRPARRLLRSRLALVMAFFSAVALVILVRLFQLQILWHDEYQSVYLQPVQRETLLETCRGSILARDGTPLARDELEFNLEVHYDNLLYDYARRHRVWDERLSRVRGHDAAADLSDVRNCTVCHLPGGTAPSSRRHLRRYKGRCLECHGDARDWKTAAASLAGQPVEEIERTIDRVVASVERTRLAVAERTGNPGVRLPEQNEYHIIAEDIPQEAAMVLETEAARFRGVRVAVTRTRRIVDGTLAPHVVGRTGAITPAVWDRLVAEGRAWQPGQPASAQPDAFRKDEEVGVAGIEQVYESALRGRIGWKLQKVVIRSLKIERVEEDVPPVGGLTVVLTLDPRLQRAANEALEAASKGESRVERGAVVVLDPSSGEVLAMSTWPTYDANRYGQPAYTRQVHDNENAPLLNRPIAGQLPPGSIFKLFTAAAALQEGAIAADSTVDCRGFLMVGGHKFKCHGPDGSINVVTAIERSCNVFFYTMAARVGGERLETYARMFGLGERTGIDLPYEKRGHVPVAASLSELYNTGIGQGRVLATPLQIARAVAVYANGGYLIRPHLMLRIQRADGTIEREADIERLRVPLDSNYIELVRRGMAQVVESGTARQSGLVRFKAAGKTGTAELWGGSNVNHAWFAGYLPREAPRFAFAVVCERVESQGGKASADVARDMFERYFSDDGGDRGGE